MSSLRILFLLTQDLESPSGLGRYLPLARGLVRLGHQVQIAALHASYQALSHKQEEMEGVLVHYVAPMHVRKESSQKQYYAGGELLQVALRAVWRLSQAALNIPADIIHVGKPHPMNSIAGLLGGLLRGERLAVDCDDYEVGSGRFAAGWQKQGVAFFERSVPRLGRLVTTNTMFMMEKLIKWGVAEERLVYLPNGVERERFREPDPARVDEIRARLGLQGREVILYVGSMSLLSHPVDLLLRAFAQVRLARPQAALVLVGGGEDLQNLVVLADAMGLAGDVHFAGRVSPEDVGLYYRLGQVALDPVHDDDAARGRSPLKLFESWAMGVPFVTADVGDRARLAGDPPAVLLARPGEPQALAEAILRVLVEPELAAMLRSRGLQRVADHDWNRLAERLEEAYRRVVCS
ncbi:MAG: glycosyltransferase family 4 protein [Anaerolineales bacterium]|nr:glycosyltransferase family 4 protein [Anaerolineales bacterium]